VIEILTPTPHEQVVSWLDSHTAPLPAEEAPVADAIGRVLAAPVEAPEDLPPVPVAAVDGYALRADATVGASEYNPLSFSVKAAGAAGVSSSEALAVVNGEPVPEGASTVIPLVDTEVRESMLDVYTPIAAGENVIPAGRELRRGDCILDAGRVLRAADAALLLESGVSTVGVIRRPRVSIMVVRRDILDTSGPMIRALVAQDGGVGVDPGIQDEDDVGSALARAECDLLLVIGGSGVGPNDRAAGALARDGEAIFRGVAINPGDTTTVGRIRETPVAILPGPPLAALFAYDAVAGRTVRTLAGKQPGWPYGSRRARLTRKVASSLGRLECCRVRVSGDAAEPLAVADNRTLATAVRADGFVLVPPHSEGFPEGAEVLVHYYDQRF
jgi:molybdopterin molybdotransferase